jgi:predicted nuclease of restriction endonuclease-like (RecB) superfamily
MVNFYDTYKDNEKLATLSGEISRSNNVAILEHCKDDFQREFYIKSCKKFGRSYRVLINMVDGQYYERYMIAHKANNLDTALLPEQVQDTKLALKDTYMFDFL